jgi:hypothetical protein
VLVVGGGALVPAPAAGVTAVDVVGTDPYDGSLTILADVADGGVLADAWYDCAIVPEAGAGPARAAVWASLAPGGVLLAPASGLRAVKPR